MLAATVVVAALGAGATYTRARRPIELAGTGGFGDADRVTDAFGRERLALAYRDRTLVYGVVVLHNPTRVAMRIEQVGRSMGPPGLPFAGIVDFRPDSDLLPPPHAYTYDGAPFAPFTLPPDEDRAVAVALWLDNCEYSSPGSYLTLGDVPVRYRILGMTRTVAVPLDTGWSVGLAKAADCPRTPPTGAVP